MMFTSFATGQTLQVNMQTFIINIYFAFKKKQDPTKHPSWEPLEYFF